MDNPRIIHAPMNGRRYAVTSPITQYDYGYLLLPEGEELPTVYEIDFSNDEHKGTSLTVYGGAEGAEVPEELIRTGKDVYAFYYRVGDGYGKTEFTWRLPNKCRPSRDGETPTPSQQSSIDQLIVRSNEAVESAEQSASDADVSAQSAKEDADRAEQARDDAQTAQGKAEDAQESAERAKTSERNASESERKAKGYAETASAKADSITGLTATATTLPDGSQASASYNAETGVMSFGIPKGKDGTNGTDGISPSVSVTDITGGHRVVITDKDGAKSFDVEDGATGATPNLTIGTVETLEPSESATASITGTPENPVLNLGIPQGERGEVTLEEFYKAFPTDTASGAVASFSDGADGLPLKSLVVNIDPVQDTSNGDPSPENICPISGWTGVNITATNSNLRGGIDLANDIKERIPSATIDTEEKTVSWRYDASHISVNIPKVPFKENTRYTFIVTVQNASKRLNFRIYYTDGSVQALPDLTTTEKETLAIVTTANKTVRTIVKQAQGGKTKLYYDESGVFEGVLTASDFQQFGRTIPISWQTEAGTVYGGKLDVLRGVLRVEMIKETFSGDLPSVSWNASKYARLAFSHTADTTKYLSNLCNEYKISNSGATGTLQLASGVVARAWDNRFVDADTMKSILNDTPIEYCYYLAEPIKIQLTPTEVRSLLGANNIFADTGDTEVEYRADTKLYIEKLTQPEEDDMIADSAITSGQFFMVGNTLYRALANIASGATITVGTNAQRVSLSDALNLVNS